MTILADMTSFKNDPEYEISICNVAIMGTKYGRDVQEPRAVSMRSGSPFFLEISKIKSLYPIGNELDIGIRM